MQSQECDELINSLIKDSICIHQNDIEYIKYIRIQIFFSF